MPALLRQYPDAVQPNTKRLPKSTEILGFNLPVDMIATSHGVVWRDNPTQIVELYLEMGGRLSGKDRQYFFSAIPCRTILAMADAITLQNYPMKWTPTWRVKIFNVARSDKMK